jgi:hypothetical protein
MVQNVSGQRLLKNIQNRAQEKIEERVEQRANEQVDKEIDKQLDKVEDALLLISSKFTKSIVAENPFCPVLVSFWIYGF